MDDVLLPFIIEPMLYSGEDALIRLPELSIYHTQRAIPSHYQAGPDEHPGPDHSGGSQEEYDPAEQKNKR